MSAQMRLDLEGERLVKNVSAKRIIQRQRCKSGEGLPDSQDGPRPPQIDDPVPKGDGEPEAELRRHEADQLLAFRHEITVIDAGTVPFQHRKFGQMTVSPLGIPVTLADLEDRRKSLRPGGTASTWCSGAGAGMRLGVSTSRYSRREKKRRMASSIRARLCRAGVFLDTRQLLMQESSLSPGSGIRRCGCRREFSALPR